MKIGNRLVLVKAALGGLIALPCLSQPYGEPDRDAPGDAMIQAYLASLAERLDGQFLEGIESREDWETRRSGFRDEYYYMLGLWPVPEKTPLQTAITGQYAGEGFVVDKLHYQSRPGLYVTANLYRPTDAPAGGRLPAVLYVCGHSNQGRDGNKTAYQSHGIWFARHGYICLVLDTLQLGEIAAIHHGTYRENRWWWHSRGYTPAGVECWNGIRGIDYLESRDDVDPARIAVTGISGGGAATFWIAAADERVRVAVPVSGMADLLSYVPNRVINGHCDCMFLYNTFEWPWTRIAALIAPRPLLFVNSDHDGIFPMDANDRVINRLERVYRFYGAGDWVDSVVSMGGHAYRQDIRQAAFRFINTHLKNDPQPVIDSEIDLVTRNGNERQYPIPPRELRVFPEDSDLPQDQRNTTIDQQFVPLASVEAPASSSFEPWRNDLLRELRRVCFRWFPDRVPPARVLAEGAAGDLSLETEPGIAIQLRLVEFPPGPADRGRILLVVQGAASGAEDAGMDWLHDLADTGDWLYRCEPRGVGATRWTRKNPPNYVERSLVLLGQTADAGRVWDIIATARFLKAKHGGERPLWVAGQGAAGVLAAYAALWESEIDGVIADHPPAGHMDSGAPQILNILRVCDIPQVLGMLAPRPLALRNAADDLVAQVRSIYETAQATERLSLK